MKIRQEIILEALQTWRLSRNEEARARILTEISPFIRNYPGFVWGCRDEDLKSDFYLYVLERLDVILRHYDETKCRFVTYLSVCLRHAWWRLKRYSRRDPDMSLDVLAEAGIEPGIPPVEPAEPAEGFQFIGSLSPVSRMVLRLHDPESLEPCDLETLRRVSERSLGECALFIEDLLAETRRKRFKQNHLEGLIGRFHRTLQTRQARPDHDPAGDVVLRQKAENALKRYRRVRVRPPARLIASFLKWTPDQVYQILRDARRQYKEKAA